MPESKIEMSGKAMAVLTGVVYIIGPWLTPLGLGSKFLILLFGIGLIILGTRN